MTKTSTGEKIKKGIISLLLLPIWLCLHLISALFSVASAISSPILRKVCYIALFLDIVMICITGESTLFILFLICIGIVWAVPMIAGFVVGICGGFSDCITAYWKTPSGEKWYNDNNNSDNDNNNSERTQNN